MINKINHTQIANEIIDKYMNGLSGSSFKVLIVICRKTIGWHKETDAVSLTQIMKMTGLSNRSVIDSIKDLEEKKIILVDRKKSKENYNHTNKYTINYTSGEDSSLPSEDSSLESSEDSSHTKESLLKETKTKEKESTKPESKEANSLAHYLFSQIMEHSKPPTWNKRPPDPNKWTSDIDKLIRLDGINTDDIKKVIEWAVKDDFWKKNIQSGNKLRQKYNQLYASMNNKPKDFYAKDLEKAKELLKKIKW